MSDSGSVPLARAAHKVLEPLHTMVYFVPEAGELYQAAGIKGGMRAYFASRSAPLGVVPAEVVIATFYNFSPALVRKAIPSCWEGTTPDAVLAARYDAVDAAWTRLLGEAELKSDEMAEAAALAREACSALDLEIVGRPLFAGHASLPWPEPEHLQLWHAATLLREHRGDGHLAALVLAGLSGLEASVSYVAYGSAMNEELQRATRGYSEEEWNGTKVQLQDKGIFDADNQFTDQGRRQREEIEAQTDAAAATPYKHLGEERTQRLIELVRPWARSISKQVFG
jgi:hypothetical protein